MPSIRYLNTILTLIAFLLCLQLFTAWSTDVSNVGYSAGLDTAQSAYAGGIGSERSGVDQRREIIALINKGNSKLDKLVDLFTSGKAKVKVEESAKKVDKK